MRLQRMSSAQYSCADTGSFGAYEDVQWASGVHVTGVQCTADVQVLAVAVRIQGVLDQMKTYSGHQGPT